MLEIVAQLFAGSKKWEIQCDKVCQGLIHNVCASREWVSRGKDPVVLIAFYNLARLYMHI